MISKLLLASGILFSGATYAQQGKNSSGVQTQVQAKKTISHSGSGRTSRETARANGAVKANANANINAQRNANENSVLNGTTTTRVKRNGKNDRSEVRADLRTKTKAGNGTRHRQSTRVRTDNTRD